MNNGYDKAIEKIVYMLGADNGPDNDEIKAELTDEIIERAYETYIAVIAMVKKTALAFNKKYEEVCDDVMTAYGK